MSSDCKFSMSAITIRPYCVEYVDHMDGLYHVVMHGYRDTDNATSFQTQYALSIQEIMEDDYGFRWRSNDEGNMNVAANGRYFNLRLTILPNTRMFDMTDVKNRDITIATDVTADVIRDELPAAVYVVAVGMLYARV